MDKKKFDAGFRALCIAVGFQLDPEQESFTLQVYYRKLQEKGFTDEIWGKTVNRMIDTWRPQYGVKFPPVAEFLDAAGVSAKSYAIKAFEATQRLIRDKGYNQAISFGRQYKHLVAHETIRKMGGWVSIAGAGVVKFRQRESEFIELYEKIFYEDNELKVTPLLGASDSANKDFLENYNKNQIEGKSDNA